MRLRQSIAVLIMLLALSIRSISQTALTKEDYLKKNKSQKTAAFIMLGAGAAVTVGAAILDVSSDWSKSETPYLVAICTGGASMLGSIPLFIASKRNKRNAMNLSFRFQQIPVPNGNSFTKIQMPSMGLKISL